MQPVKAWHKQKKSLVRPLLHKQLSVDLVKESVLGLHLDSALPGQVYNRSATLIQNNSMSTNCHWSNFGSHMAKNAVKRKTMLLRRIMDKTGKFWQMILPFCGFHMLVLGRASNKGEDGEEHGDCWNCKPNGPWDAVLDVHHNCYGQQWAKVDGKVEPVEEAFLLFPVLEMQAFVMHAMLMRCDQQCASSFHKDFLDSEDQPRNASKRTKIDCKAILSVHPCSYTRQPLQQNLEYQNGLQQIFKDLSLVVATA